MKSLDEKEVTKKTGPYSTNTRIFRKSKSLNKFTSLIDKDEILKEFIDYKISCHSFKKNNLKKVDRSTSNSKGKYSSGSNLIKIRTVKLKSDTNESGKKTVNVSQSDFNKSRDKISASRIGVEVYRKKDEISTNLSNSENETVIKKLNNRKFMTRVINKQFEPESESESKLRNKKLNVDIYDLHKICNSHSPDLLYDDLFLNIKNTVEKEKSSKEKSNVTTINNFNTKNDFFSDSNNAISNSKLMNINYEKYTLHLLEQITYLNYKINEYKLEKEKLSKELDGTDNITLLQIEKLEREIKGYKNMINSCIKTCSQLAEEIIVLRKEIEKFTSCNTNMFKNEVKTTNLDNKKSTAIKFK